jgi:hypothetical protein
MGHGRTHDILSADAHVSGPEWFRASRSEGVSGRPADFFDMTSEEAASDWCKPNVWRQARQMRQEWRHQRYSRLRG